MADMVDRRLFAELASRRSEEVVMPNYCEYREDEKCYLVHAWNGSYAIYPEQELIEPLHGTPEPHSYFCVLFA